MQTKINKWMCVDKQTHIFRALVSLLIVTMMFLSQASLAVTTYAATSVSFDDYATFLAYDQARNSIDPKSGATENKDFALADTDAIEDTTTDNIPSVWGLIANVADAKAAGKIDSVKQPVLTKLSATAQRITSSTTQAKFTEQVKAVYAAAGGKIKIHTGTGAYEAGDSNYASKLRTAVGNFNAAQASSAATDVFESIYGAENWHPDTGLATEAMAVIYSVVNVIFTVVAQIIMWFFMAQSAFDLFYISFEPIRPFIGPKGSGESRANNNGGGGFWDKFCIPICSNAAVEAANGSSKGGMDGGASTNSSKAAINYIIKRAPLLITIAIYFILSVMGYWTKVIGWVADFVIRIFNFILSIGG